MANVAKMIEASFKALDAPRTGDRWHEMFSFWIYVLEASPVTITLAEGHGDFEKTGKIWRGNYDEFRKRMTYESRDKPIYMLADRGNDVSWGPELEKIIKLRKTANKPKEASDG